ncbi:MAG: RHS repeat-associated core domain-containing protein, partial [Terriglobales bacterium]
ENGPSAQASVFYVQANHVGSTEWEDDAGGAATEAIDADALGAQQSVWQANTLTQFDFDSFTGKPRDNSTGFDYFGARYYGSALGRFLTPDPAGLAAVDPGNPQSWNRYAYALNNPVTNTDPTGLLAVVPQGCVGTPNADPTTGDYYMCPDDGDPLPPFQQPWDPVDPGGTEGPGGVDTQTPTTKPPKGPSCSGGNAQFVLANEVAAADIASVANATTANILGLSSYESGWGQSNIARNYGNFFGLTAGRNFTGTIGVYRSPNGYAYGVYPSPGFLTSGMSFAESPFGRRVSGITDPTAFAQALVGGAYNSEHINPPYWQQLVDRIGAVEAILAACLR